MTTAMEMILITNSVSSSMNSILSETNSIQMGLEDMQKNSSLHPSTSDENSAPANANISMSLPNMLNMEEEEGISETVVCKMTRDDCLTMVLPSMEEKLLPASKGATLRTALECLRQDLCGVQVQVHGTRIPLSFDTELSTLRGTRLYIIARTLNLDSASECTETSFMRRESIDEVYDEYPEFSDDILLQDYSSDTIKRAKNKKGSKENSDFYYPFELPAMEKMQQLLDYYAKFGIPQQPHILNFHGQHRQELGFGHWQELVKSWEQLDEVEMQQQNAIWELVQSEDDYLHMLNVCQELFIACICNLQNESLMFDIDTEKLFGSIQEVYSGNVSFWQDYIVKMLEKSSDTGEPLDPTMLAEAFSKCEELFHAYKDHSLEQSRCMFYCKKSCYQNQLFKTYLTWCECQPMCGGRQLKEMIVTPMSRLSKYSVLLTPIALKTKQHEKQMVLHDMICQIDGYVLKVNNALKHQYEQQRLREISNKIETCDIVDVRDDELAAVVQKHSSLNLSGPMPGCPEHLSRNLIHRAELKIKDINSPKLDVQVLLFTDMMLVTKSMQKKSEKVKIIRPPYHIDFLEVVEVKDGLSIGLVYVNEWRVAESSFILHFTEQHEHKTWLEMFQRTKILYNEAKNCKVRRKLTFTN